MGCPLYFYLLFSESPINKKSFFVLKQLGGNKVELDKILNTASLTEEEKTILMVLKFIGNETYVSDDYLVPLTSLTKTDLAETDNHDYNEEQLRLAGVDKIFHVSAVKNKGIKKLKKFLED